jgi:hypothetical protein
MQSRVRRLQLRGSGGFSPRFPNIAPAELRLTTIGNYWCKLRTAFLPCLFHPAARRRPLTAYDAE